MTGNFISVEGIAKRYVGAGGSTIVFENLWLSMARGEFVCVIGHSGRGKTTVLNIPAGLDLASEGTVIVDGRAIEGTSLDRAVIFQRDREIRATCRRCKSGSRSRPSFLAQRSVESPSAQAIAL